MKITYRGQHGFRLPARLRWKQAALCALIIDLLPAPLFAQRPRMTYNGQVVVLPKRPDDRVVVDKGDAQTGAGENETMLDPAVSRNVPQCQRYQLADSPQGSKRV